MAKKEDDKFLVRKHYTLVAYAEASKGTEPINDPELIEDNTYPSSTNEHDRIIDSLVLNHEMNRYKTKNGMWKGFQCTWVLQVTSKGFKAIEDEKYLKEYDAQNDKNQERLLRRLQIKELKTKWIWAIIGFGSGVLSALVTAYLLGVLKLNL